LIVVIMSEGSSYHSGGRGGGSGGRGRGRGGRGGGRGRSEEAVVIPSCSEPFIDAHCHIEYIMQRAHVQSWETFMSRQRFPPNYRGCICSFCDPAALSPSFSMWGELLAMEGVYGSFGIHPHNSKYYNDRLEETIISIIKEQPKAIAWGEIGLDFDRNASPRDVQISIFKRQITRAVELGVPIVVHSRLAAQETFDCLKETAPADMHIHLHCFSDSPEWCEKYLTAFPNLKVGFTCSVLRPSSAMARSAAVAPLDRILLETDGPYMPPSGNKMSHPGVIPAVAQAIADIKHVTLSEVLTACYKNTRDLYGIE